jgi:hypothetical protein
MSSTLYSEKGWLTMGVAIRVGTGLKVQKLVGGKSRKRQAKLKQLGQRVWVCT